MLASPGPLRFAGGVVVFSPSGVVVSTDGAGVVLLGGLGVGLLSVSFLPPYATEWTVATHRSPDGKSPAAGAQRKGSRDIAEVGLTPSESNGAWTDSPPPPQGWFWTSCPRPHRLDRRDQSGARCAPHRTTPVPHRTTPVEDPAAGPARDPHDSSRCCRMLRPDLRGGRGPGGDGQRWAHHSAARRRAAGVYPG